MTTSNETGTSRIEKMLRTDIKKQPQKDGWKKRKNTGKYSLNTEKSRIEYIKEFYGKKRSELVERVSRTKSVHIHRQILYQMRSLAENGKFVTTVEEQIKFNSELEWAFRMINAHTGKNIWIRAKNSEFTSGFSMYYSRIEDLKDADKAKIRNFITKLKKDEMMEKYARK